MKTISLKVPDELDSRLTAAEWEDAARPSSAKPWRLS